MMSPVETVPLANGKKFVVQKGPRKVVKAAPTVVIEDETERHAFIPDKKYAAQYVHRDINGIRDFDMMDLCMKKHWNILLRGDTGAGKTMMPMAYAAERGLRYYSVPCDISIDPTALMGKMMPTEEMGKFRWADGPVTELVRYGGVLNISEVNAMSPKVGMSLFPVLDHRRSISLLGHNGEVIEAHPDLLIVADMNPNYLGTNALNSAFANRWDLKVDWGYLPEIESKLVKCPSLLDIARKIRNLPDVRTPVPTNSMQIFEALAPDLGLQFAIANFVAQFAPSEREGIKNVFQVNEANLQQELALIQQGKKPDDELESMEADSEWFEEKADPSNFEFEDEEEDEY